jgi:hypothetical protein
MVNIIKKKSKLLAKTGRAQVPLYCSVDTLKFIDGALSDLGISHSRSSMFIKAMLEYLKKFGYEDKGVESNG